VTITARKPESSPPPPRSWPPTCRTARSGCSAGGNAGDAASRAETVATTVQRFGSLDILINNAGVNPVTAS